MRMPDAPTVTAAMLGTCATPETTGYTGWPGAAAMSRPLWNENAPAPNSPSGWKGFWNTMRGSPKLPRIGCAWWNGFSGQPYASARGTGRTVPSARAARTSRSRIAPLKLGFRPFHTHQLAETARIAWRRRLVFVPEVAVDVASAVEQRPQPSRPAPELRLVIRRLAQAQIAKRRRALECADTDGIRRKLRLDPLPRVVAEVERHLDLRIQRAENERHQALVERRPDQRSDRPEPTPEEPNPLDERGHVHAPMDVHLHREPEARRRLLGPP